MSRIAEEKLVVEAMVRLYCRRKEGNRTLCPQCAELLSYAHARLDHCRYGDSKPTCRRCPLHCYRPDMRARVRSVMRWAAPRWLLYDPLAFLRHYWRELRHT
ncbi:MAG: nitrous oxide-stimulated promoter family protein [Bacteroidaceae bacterium]|nr:nitrous oxide-stimulated promoter family protein [Bacteroidaceae bacterium]